MNTASLFKPNDVVVSVFAQSDVGMARKANEDSYLIADLNTGTADVETSVSTYRIGERGSLLMVSDGIREHLASHDCSMMASSTMLETLMNLQDEKSPLERLSEATRVTNDVVWNYAGSHPELAGMG